MIFGKKFKKSFLKDFVKILSFLSIPVPGSGTTINISSAITS